MHLPPSLSATHSSYKSLSSLALYADKRKEEVRNALETVDDLTYAQRLLAMTYAQMGKRQKAGFSA